MVTVAFTGFGTCMVHVAWPLLSLAVCPSTATVEPTKASAVVCCALFSIEIRVPSCSFCLSCCSTPANCTSCWVNWLVSSGSSGFWFLSCVVSSVRKVWKLPAMVLPSMPVELDEELLLVLVLLVTAAVTWDVMGAMVLVSMALSSHADVDAAARGQHAAVAAQHRVDGGSFGIGHDELGRGWHVLVLAAAGEALIAQRERQAVVGGLESGILQGALQIAGVAPEEIEGLGLVDHQAGGD